MKIHPETQARVEKELQELHHRLRLGVVMVLELNGQVIAFSGTETAPTELASLFAGVVSASSAITHRLGLQAGTQWAQWSGNGGVVLLPIGSEYSLAVLFHNHRFPGWVRMQANTACAKLARLLDENKKIDQSLESQQKKDLPAGSRVGKLFGAVSDDEIDRLFSGV